MSDASTLSNSVRTLARVLSPAANRTAGEWVTDSVFFGIALVNWYLSGRPMTNPQISDSWWPFDWVVGMIACVLIWWTRRYPLTIGAIMIVPGALAITSAVPVLVSVYRMGLLGRLWLAVAITIVHIATALPYHAVAPMPGLPWEVWVVVIPLIYSLSLCIGLLGRARRQLIVNLRETGVRDRQRY